MLNLNEKELNEMIAEIKEFIKVENKIGDVIENAREFAKKRLLFNDEQAVKYEALIINYIMSKKMKVKIKI